MPCACATPAGAAIAANAMIVVYATARRAFMLAPAGVCYLTILVLWPGRRVQKVAALQAIP